MRVVAFLAFVLVGTPVLIAVGTAMARWNNRDWHL